MVIKVSPRAATAAFGTWHAKSRSSGKDLNYQKLLDVPRLQQRAWESFTSKAATKDDNLIVSSFSPSSCAAIPHWGGMVFVYDQSWNSSHGGLSYQIIEGIWFWQKYGANLPPVKGNLIENFRITENHHHHITSHLITSHHITSHLTTSHHITSHLTTSHNISMIAPRIKWGFRPTQPSAKSTDIHIIYRKCSKDPTDMCHYRLYILQRSLSFVWGR